jgi:hypothetical protein
VIWEKATGQNDTKVLTDEERQRKCQNKEK